MSAVRTTDWYPSVSGKCEVEVAAAIRYAFDAIYNLRGRVETLEGTPVVPPAVTAGGGISIYDITLTAPATGIPAPVEEDGKILLFILRQDSTGGRTVTWDAVFGAAVEQPGGDPDSLSSIFFYVEDATHIRPLTAMRKNQPL